MPSRALLMTTICMLATALVVHAADRAIGPASETIAALSTAGAATEAADCVTLSDPVLAPSYD
jgi:hypothetical protein